MQTYATASIEFIALVIKLLELTGINIQEILSAADLDISHMTKKDSRISAETMLVIWQAVEKSNSDVNLGLHLGEKVFEYPGHVLFSILFNSETVGAGFEKFCQYHNLMNDILNPGLRKENTKAIIFLHYSDLKLAGFRHINEAMMTLYLMMLKRVTENRVKLEAVHFTHLKPHDISEHKRIFKAPILFNQKENKFIFNRKYLKIPIFYANSELLKKLESYARQLQNQYVDSATVAGQVAQHLLKTIPKKNPDINSIAKNMGMSPRNLQIKLKQEGVSYQHVLDQLKQQVSSNYLTKTDLSIFEITCLLGYSNQSAFNRSFKRWTGTTPRKYRIENHKNN